MSSVIVQAKVFLIIANHLSFDFIADILHESSVKSLSFASNKVILFTVNKQWG
jgi:hypothetical protein